MGVYLIAKFEASTIIRARFRQREERVILPPSQPQNEPKRTPKKPTKIRVKR